MPTDFSLTHASGKWNLVGRLLSRDVPRWRPKGGMTVHTELNSVGVAALNKILDTSHWDYYRGPNNPGKFECAISWDATTWTSIEGGVQQLSDLQYRQVSGRLFPKFHATWVRLRHRATLLEVTVVAIHMPLRNTAQRVKVSNDCLGFLAEWLLTIEGHVIVSADWNIAWRKSADRALLEPLAKATGMTWAWDGNVEGFDTKRSLIDGVLTNLPVRESTLLPAVASSDHWPVRVDLTLPDRTPTTPEAPVARQARSLDVLLAEVNKFAPRRSKASDGGLGDPAHAARVSDHNPNGAGVWRARDFTNDPGDGFDANLFANLVARKLGVHPALGSGAYVIWNRRIISTDRLREGWRPYSGANPHNKHVHVSVGRSGYDTTAPWNILKVERVYQPGERDLGFREGRDPLSGPDVKFVQKKVGLGVQDGFYGPKTHAAVKAWEKQHNARKAKPRLLEDGIVGTGTWEAFGVKVDPKKYNK